MVLWTDTPISAVELCSTFRVIFGLFVASLINALLAWSVWVGGRPSLGRFVVVTHSLNFLKNDLMVLRGMLKVYDFILNPTLIGTSPQLCSGPVWRAPRSSWCRLLGGVHCLVVLQTLGPFRTYTEIM